MEGLVLLFGELCAMVAVTFVVVLLPVAVACGELCVALVVWLFSWLRRPSQPVPQTETAAATAPPSGKRAGWRWPHYVALTSASIVLFVALTIAALDLFFFEATMRWVCGRLQTKTDIAVTFAEAEGSLWRGHIELKKTRVTRNGNAFSDFDLAADRAVVDLSLSQLWQGDRHIRRVEFEGLHGTYHRIAVRDKSVASKPFQIDQLLVRDASLEVHDKTRGKQGVHSRLQIDALHTEPLRSDWAAFDMLFRTNAQGQIDGAPFVISSHEVEGGRQTNWKMDDLPIASLATYLGGPLEWIDTGVIDVDVNDRWVLGETPDIAIQCNFVLRDFRAQVPEDMSKLKKSIAVPAVKFMNQHSRRLPLEFEFVLNKECFHHRASAQAAGLTTAIADGLAGEIARRAKIDPEKVKEVGNSVKQGVIKWLDRRRKSDEGADDAP
ncbi:MAG: DUF748 domain-containing protein [Planctomycetota bacterium]|nr:DUF748 domain-containing protein [Planctomycetota bacterium]